VKVIFLTISFRAILLLLNIFVFCWGAVALVEFIKYKKINSKLLIYIMFYALLALCFYEASANALRAFEVYFEYKGW